MPFHNDKWAQKGLKSWRTHYSVHSTNMCHVKRRNTSETLYLIPISIILKQISAGLHNITFIVHWPLLLPPSLRAQLFQQKIPSKIPSTAANTQLEWTLQYSAQALIIFSFLFLVSGLSLNARSRQTKPRILVQDSFPLQKLHQLLKRFEWRWRWRCSEPCFTIWKPLWLVPICDLCPPGPSCRGSRELREWEGWATKEA